MPIHDWRRVDAGVFHDFHVSRIARVRRCLSRGLVHRGYHALAEPVAGDLGPDVCSSRERSTCPCRSLEATCLAARAAVPDLLLDKLAALPTNGRNKPGRRRT